VRQARRLKEAGRRHSQDLRQVELQVKQPLQRLNESLLLRARRLRRRDRVHQRGLALRQKVRAQASLRGENAAELTAAQGVQLQSVRAEERPMCQSRPGPDRRARHQELVRPVRKKDALREKEDKLLMVSLAGSQGPVRLERPNSARDSRSAERKRARGLQRQDRNKIFIGNCNASGKEIPERLFNGRDAAPRRPDSATSYLQQLGDLYRV
jgi:hypothetical protein